MAKVHGESKLTFLESTSIIIGHGVDQEFFRSHSLHPEITGMISFGLQQWLIA